MQAMHLRHYYNSNVKSRQKYQSINQSINQSMPLLKDVGELHFSGIDGIVVVGEIIITLYLLLL